MDEHWWKGQLEWYENQYEEIKNLDWSKYYDGRDEDLCNLKKEIKECKNQLKQENKNG
jgi:hypothetical protein